MWETLQCLGLPVEVRREPGGERSEARALGRGRIGVEMVA